MSTRIAVARTHDVPEGAGVVVEAGGKLVALFNDGGRFYALDNTCLHRGGPIGQGDLDEGIVTCPWHGWQYDVATGRHILDRSIGLRSYPVVIEEGRIHLEID